MVIGLKRVMVSHEGLNLSINVEKNAIEMWSVIRFGLSHGVVFKRGSTVFHRNKKL
jgi:hypothetical protein